jgi:peptide deformylase
VLINPVIEPLSDEMAEDWEGCLSVPGMRGVVPRHTHIRYRALSLSGEVIDREARGFHARVVQHECDHLDGILYPQRMTDLSKLIFNSEERHWMRQAQAAETAEAE